LLHGLFYRREGSGELSEYRANVELYFCVCIHRYMNTKTISIRDDTYNLLKNAKLEGESFSDVIDRLLVKE